MSIIVLIVIALLAAACAGVYWAVKHPDAAKAVSDAEQAGADKITAAAERVEQAVKKAAK